MLIHRIVNSVFNSCTYVVHDETSRQAMIVDCGDVEPIIDYIEKNGLVLRYVLLTHSHFDHIYGLNAIVQKSPEVKIITNDFGAEALFVPKLNFSRYHTDCEDFIFCGGNDLIQKCFDSETLSICSLEVNIITTPGHDPSCLTFKIGDYLFTGDSYIPGVKVLATFPKSDKKMAKENEEKLKDMGKNGLTICAGHVVV